jgi:hypothetical protein
MRSKADPTRTQPAAANPVSAIEQGASPSDATLPRSLGPPPSRPDPVPELDRARLYEDHPVVRNTAMIATRPVREAYDVVTRAIVHHDPGTCLIGEFRLGKTTTLVKIAETLEQTFPGLPVGRVNAKGHDKPSEKVFYTDILTDYNHGGARTGTTSDRRTRVLNLLRAHAAQRSSNRYLLLVDEGQNWGESELQVLRDLSNDLQRQGVDMVTVMFGHPEMHHIRSRLLARGRTDLIGRFLLTPCEFRGMRNRDDLTHCLQAYDEAKQHEFPQGSGICYSAFFLPQAWGRGWRLAEEGPRFWNAISRVAARCGRTPNNIGMSWITGAIRNFFFSQTPMDGLGFVGTQDAWDVAVEHSGYEASLV